MSTSSLLSGSTTSTDISEEMAENRTPHVQTWRRWDHRKQLMVNWRYYGDTKKLVAEKDLRECLEMLIDAGEIHKSEIGIQPHLPPTPSLGSLTITEKEAISLRLLETSGASKIMGKRAFKKLQRLQKKRRKMEEKAKIAKKNIQAMLIENNGLTDRQLKRSIRKERYRELKLLKAEQNQRVYYVETNGGTGEADADGKIAGPSNFEPETFLKHFVENRKQEIERQKKVERIQENERRRLSRKQQRSFLDRSFDLESHNRTRFSEKNDYDDTFVEVFDDTGKLISVNGIALDYQGRPIHEESVDTNGNLISINNVLVENIPGYTGSVVRDERGHLISMFGPPARELIRDGNGKLLCLNGKRVHSRYEEVEGAFEMVKKMNENAKESDTEVLTTLGKMLEVNSRPSKVEETLLKQVKRAYKQHKRNLKREVKMAKWMKKEQRKEQTQLENENVKIPRSSTSSPNVKQLSPVQRIVTIFKRNGRTSNQSRIEDVPAEIKSNAVDESSIERIKVDVKSKKTNPKSNRLLKNELKVQNKMPAKQKKEIEKNEKAHEKAANKSNKRHEKLHKLDVQLDQKLQHIIANMKKLEKLNSLHDQEQRATIIRSKVIAELEKQVQQNATKQVYYVKKQNAARKEEDQSKTNKKLAEIKNEEKEFAKTNKHERSKNKKHLKMKIKKLQDQQNKRNKIVKNRDKELSTLKKLQKKLSKDLQMLGKAMEDKQKFIENSCKIMELQTCTKESNTLNEKHEKEELQHHKHEIGELQNHKQEIGELQHHKHEKDELQHYKHKIGDLHHHKHEIGEMKLQKHEKGELQHQKQQTEKGPEYEKGRKLEQEKDRGPETLENVERCEQISLPLEKAAKINFIRLQKENEMLKARNEYLEEQTKVFQQTQQEILCQNELLNDEINVLYIKIKSLQSTITAASTTPKEEEKSLHEAKYIKQQQAPPKPPRKMLFVKPEWLKKEELNGRNDETREIQPTNIKLQTTNTGEQLVCGVVEQIV